MPSECIYVFRVVLGTEQKLFPQTSFSDLFLQPRQSIDTVQYELDH